MKNTIKSKVFNAIAALLIVAATLSAASCSSDHSTTPVQDKESLAHQLSLLVSNKIAPGAAGIIITRDSISDQQVAGVRKAGASDKLAKDDLIHIGSLTKFMTATMIGILVDEGKLSWNAKPAEFIPDLAASLDPGYANITLLDILHHRAGIPADDDFDTIPELSGTLPEQRLQAALLVLSMPPAVTPGTYRYSNVGYAIAACMAEVATGQDWRSLMNTKLFQPLGITAFYGWPTQHDSEEPWGHELTDQGFVPVPPSVEPAEIQFLEPAGFVSMTLGDYAKFIQLQMDAMQGNPRLLSAAAFQVLRTPVEDYACGIRVIETPRGTLYWHNGSNTYFYMVLYLIPSQDLSIVVAINAGDESLYEPVGIAAETVLVKLFKP